MIPSQREEEKEENRLSEEAEQSFDQLQTQGEDDEEEEEDEPVTMTDQSEVPAAHPEVTYQIEDENRASSSTITVPAIVTAT